MCPGCRWPATASWPSAESPSSPPISPPTKTTPTLPTTEPNSLFSPPTFVFHPQLSLVQSFPSTAISISVLLSAIVAISWYVRPFQCLFLPPSPSLPQPSRNFEIPFEFSHPPSPSWPGLSSVIETSLSGFADFPTPKLALLPLWIPRCPNPSRLCPPSTRCLFSHPNLSHLFPPFPTFYHTFSLPPKHHSPLTFVATVTACIASHPLTAPSVQIPIFLIFIFRMEPTSTSPAIHGADGHGRSDVHSFVESKEADHVPARSFRNSDDSVLVTRTIEQTVDDSGQPRHERPVKKKRSIVSPNTRFFLVVAAAIVLVGFGSAYLAGLFQRKSPFISCLLASANSPQWPTASTILAPAWQDSSLPLPSRLAPLSPSRCSSLSRPWLAWTVRCLVRQPRLLPLPSRSRRWLRPRLFG